MNGLANHHDGDIFRGDGWRGGRGHEDEGVFRGGPAFDRPFVRDVALVEAGGVVGQVARGDHVHAGVDHAVDRARGGDGGVHAHLSHVVDQLDRAIAHVVLALGDRGLDHVRLDVVDDVGRGVEGDNLDVAGATGFIDGGAPGGAIVGVDAEGAGQVRIGRDCGVGQVESGGRVLAVVDRLEGGDGAAFEGGQEAVRALQGVEGGVGAAADADQAAIGQELLHGFARDGAGGVVVGADVDQRDAAVNRRRVEGGDEDPGFRRAGHDRLEGIGVGGSDGDAGHTLGDVGFHGLDLCSHVFARGHEEDHIFRGQAQGFPGGPDAQLDVRPVRVNGLANDHNRDVILSADQAAREQAGDQHHNQGEHETTLHFGDSS